MYTRPARPAADARGRTAWRGNTALTVAGIGFGATMAISAPAVLDAWPTPGGPYLAAGTVAAMAGTYLCLMLLLLIARIPWVEREVGHDRLIAMHRALAPYTLVLIAAHVALTMLGYASGAVDGWWQATWLTVTTGPWMMPAAAAFVTMIALGVISYRGIRARMKYETWWVAHLYFYLAVALSFGHQVELGPMFAAHPTYRWGWIALYLAVAGLIIAGRIVAPILFSLRHQLHVSSVTWEAPGVVSVHIAGRRMADVTAKGGQFFQWRFLTRHWWWQAHPYSLSSAPDDAGFRITVKDLGDQSGGLPELTPGTRVLAEGPYGVFTAAARTGDKVAAFAAGVGVTPVRAMLDDLPPVADVVICYRASDAGNAPLREELAAMAAAHGWQMHFLPGSRDRYRFTGAALHSLMPDIADRDVYVCGPAPFTDAVLDAAREAGVPEGQLHHEEFEF